MVSAAGGGYSRWNRLALTRWLEDSMLDNWDTFFYLRDNDDAAAWSTTVQPILHVAKTAEGSFKAGSVRFTRRDHEIELCTDVAISPDDNAELRRVGITNRSSRSRSLSATCYAEIVLADPIACNNWGEFTADAGEYVITSSISRMTPAPWVNVLASPQFGTLLSENGSATTRSETAHQFSLTPWSNDPVSDANTEALYIRDDESGRRWSPTSLPAPGAAPYTARHGFDYCEDDIESRLCIYVAMDSPAKFSVLTLHNRSDRTRRLSVSGYLDWVLGDERGKTQMHVVTEVDASSGPLFARNPYRADFAGRGGWTWYTGSAAWLYRLIVESLLGLRRRGNELQTLPLLPSEWSEFKMEHHFGMSTYRIACWAVAPAGEASVPLNGRQLQNGVIAMIDDGREHSVVVNVRRAS